jgi:hypothetical protein
MVVFGFRFLFKFDLKKADCRSDEHVPQLYCVDTYLRCSQLVVQLETSQLLRFGHHVGGV